MATILPVIQIVLSVLLVVAVLLQSRSAGIGALGGSDTTDTSFGTRRGFEKFLFFGTIIIAILFAIVSIFSFIFA
jgi:preprotein translocase subunit SecG